MTTQTYLIEGMTCEHCRRHVGDAFGTLAGVRGVHVSLESGEARVESDAPLDHTAVAQALDEAGYQLR